ncbi:MAG TPA: hypothetical protein VMZ91_06680 [Candidatus Paceibacterota bacterium]|nr:hypothetical protein [Candidatus Paceibacterota bacterium]
MEIDKENLSQKFKEGDWEYVFKDVLEISGFIISNNFKIYDPEIQEDIKQECAENFLKKVQQGKVDSSRNIFAFIWKNSRFRILEILRKQSNRDRIAKFISYDSLDTTDYIDNRHGIGDKYLSLEEREMWTL